MLSKFLLIAMLMAAMAGAQPNPLGPQPPVGAALGIVELLRLSPDLREEKRVSRDLSDVNVVFFGDPGCPIAKLYLARLIGMHDELKAQQKSVSFFLVYGQRNVSLERSTKQARQGHQGSPVPFTAIYDKYQSIGRALGVTTLSETFVLNAKGSLLYRGAVDDQYTIADGRATRKTEPSRSFLKEAIARGLDHSTPELPRTKPSGCYVSLKPLTFAEDIAPIFASRCAECHRADGIKGSFPVVAFSQPNHFTEVIEPFLSTIRERVADRTMPPWGADPHIGKFSNDISLTAPEREAILHWIDTGGAPGDLSKLPPEPQGPKARGSEWTLGEPDEVYWMEGDYEVPAEGIVDYVYRPGMVSNPDANGRVETQKVLVTEDRFLEWSEVIPGSPEVVHHVNVFVRRPDSETLHLREPSTAKNSFSGLKRLIAKGRHNVSLESMKGAAEIYGEDGFKAFSTLGAFVPGAAVLVYPKDHSIRVPKGSEILFEMHYTPDGSIRRDRSKIGLKWSKAAPKHELFTMAFGRSLSLVVPANTEAHVLRQDFTFEKKAAILILRPHGHLRAAKFNYELTYPDGKVQTILDIPKYDFNNQPYYTFEEPIVVPAGTRITVRGTYNNSASNPALTKAQHSLPVRWGLQTEEEMFWGFLNFSYLE